MSNTGEFLSNEMPRGHVVQFYESDGFLCDVVAAFLAEGLRAGQPILVVATELHRDGIRQQLGGRGDDVASLERSGAVTFVDASALLSRFFVNGTVDASLFRRELDAKLAACRKGRDAATVRVFGEMVDVLWRDGHTDAALQLEELWNEAAATESFALLCGYSPGHFRDAADARQQSLVAEIEHRCELEATLRRMLAEREQAELERDRLLAHAQLARENAETASRLKEEFLAVMSHELRTPLNTILGWAQIVNRPGNDEATIHRGLDVIQRNARLQLHVIDDLLDMSRIITGKMTLRLATVDLHQVLTEGVETVRPAVIAKGISLDLHMDPDARCMTGDPDRLQQIVWNLLSNALKFTPEGGRIEVCLEHSGGHVLIVVRDNGLGIAPAFLPHVFDRFRQADTGTTRNYGGLGVGLAVVRHLVEAHGGTTSVESAGEGFGATFTVRMPVHPVPTAD